MAISPQLHKIIAHATKKYMAAAICLDEDYNLVARGRNDENLAVLHKVVSDAFGAGLMHGFVIGKKERL